MIPQKKKKPQNQIFLGISFYSRISVTIVSCVAVGFFLGKALDGFFCSSPWFLLVFSLLGVLAALKSIYDMAIHK